MQIVGVRTDDGVTLVGEQSADAIGVIAEVADFWRDAPGLLASSQRRAWLPLDGVRLVPPVLPGARVLCIGLNYREHVGEGSYAADPLPEFPTVFGRWASTLSVDGADVPVPTGEDGLDWEGEVMAWVGTPLIDADPEEALAAVVGYSAFDDMTARRAQKRTSQWMLGKNGDASGPLGPLVPAREVGDLRDGLRLRTLVNGQVVQDAGTDQMIHPVGDVLALVSRSMTLRPGDLLATGTPSGVGYARSPAWLLHPGDVVRVEVERLGSVTNQVVDGAARGRVRW